MTGVGPTLEAGDETRNAVLQIAQLLNRTDKIPKSLPPIQSDSTPVTSVQPSSTSEAQLPRVQKNTLSNDQRYSLKQQLSLKRAKIRKPTLRDATWKRSNNVHLQDRYNLRPRQLAQYLHHISPKISVPRNGNYKATATRS